MTAEVVLLLTAAALIIGAIVTTSADTFKNASPALGARVEVQLETGEGFRKAWTAAPAN